MTWIETFSGGKFDLLEPRPEDVSLDDIAHALARINRFTGHTEGNGYSVAEHSLRVMRLVEYRYPEDPLLHALAGVHDAHEAYTGDVSRPMKLAQRALGSSALDDIEARVQSCVLKALGLPAPTDEQQRRIKEADVALLAVERDVFMPNTGRHPWGIDRTALGYLGSTRMELAGPLWRSMTPDQLSFLFREFVRFGLRLALPHIPETP